MSKTLMVLAITLGIVGAAMAADSGAVQAARDIQKKNQDAVITVSAVIKLQFGGRVQFGHGDEQKAEAAGTVIDPSGLTVVCYSMLDPSGAWRDMLEARGGGDDDQRYSVKSQVSDVKMRLADGTEMPARLVMQDTDLDLAFVMPEAKGAEKPASFTWVDLNKAAEPKVLDETVNLGRLGRALNRQSCVTFGRLAATVTKPRTFYVCDNLEMMGLPVFGLDGNVLGVAAIRRPESEGGMMARMAGGGMMPVVIPAKDVLELTGQALKKAAEKPAKASPSPAREPEKGPDPSKTPAPAKGD